MERRLYTYTYVAQPFDEVCWLLATVPRRLLAGAAEQAGGLAAELVAEVSGGLGAVETTTQVSLHIGQFQPKGVLSAALPLRWEPASGSTALPVLVGEVEVTCVSVRPPLTKLALVATYRPPLGLLGAAVDALLAHRVAEATAHRFLEQVAGRIDCDLTPAELLPRPSR